MVGYIVYTNTRSRDICDMYYNNLLIVIVIEYVYVGATVQYVWERRPPNKENYTSFNSNSVAFFWGGRIRIRALNIFVTHNKTKIITR